MHTTYLHLTWLLHHHGSLALFVLLAIGIVGLPVPDETLLLFSGFLAAKGDLSIFAVPVAAITGSCIGITLSYLIGRFIGHAAIVHFGKYVGITETKLKTAHEWTKKFGKYLLIIGYFIPGLRHLVGIVAGTTELEYRTFATYAYLGAVIWSLTFIIIGFFFYNQWQHWHV